MFARSTSGIKKCLSRHQRPCPPSPRGKQDPSARHRRAACAIALILFAAYTYFYQAGGWNPNSRFALVRAIVEQGTLRIDDTALFEGQLVTGDLAQSEDHIYSDKAPGLALFAAPLVALSQPFVTDPQSPAGIAWLSYLATVYAAGLPTIITALIILHAATRLGATLHAAALAALVFGLGTPAWCYSTLFYGHALTTTCLTGAFAASLALADPSSAQRDWLLATAVGLGGGWATVTEYPTVVPVALTTLLALWHASEGGRLRVFRVASGIAIWASICAGVLAWYNDSAFGSPLQIGYSSVSGFEGMSQGFFGIGRPDYRVMRQILFGPFRGLFYLTPLLIAAPVGFLILVRYRRSRLAGLTGASIIIFYLIFNASYYYWDGGWSYGPRHMAPALPFLCIALAPIWSRACSMVRAGFLVAALCGTTTAFMAVSVTAQPPDTYLRPVSELFWPNFIQGNLSMNWQSYLEYLPRDERNQTSHAWNIGEQMGLSGLPSLAPLVTAWSLIGIIWWKRNHQPASNETAVRGKNE